MKLSKPAISALKSDNSIKNLIAAAMECSESTVRRWINKNDVMLTTEACLAIIEKQTGMSRKKLLTEK